MKKNYLLYMMGGVGSRTNKNIPKQYILINGIPIFAYTLKEYDSLEYINGIIIVADKKYESYINKWVKKLNITKLISIVQGGECRSQSVLNGIKAYRSIANNNDVLLIHDASAPFVDKKNISIGIEEVKKGYFVCLGTKQSNTVYQIDSNNSINGIIPREQVVPGTCPDMFEYEKIYNIFTNASISELENSTSSIMLGINNHIPSKIIFSPILPIKITYENDIETFRELVDIYYFPGFKKNNTNLLEYDNEILD